MPRRAALFSGPNHHTNAASGTMEIDIGFPAHTLLMFKENSRIAEIPKGNGYNTAWYDTIHNVQVRPFFVYYAPGTS